MRLHNFPDKHERSGNRAVQAWAGFGHELSRTEPIYSIVELEKLFVERLSHDLGIGPIRAAAHSLRKTGDLL